MAAYKTVSEQISHIMTTSLLAKTIAIGAVAVSGVTTMYYYQFYKQIRKTAIYTDAIQILHDTEKAMKYLGEPVHELKPILKDIDNNTRSLTIALKGSNTSGKLNCIFLTNVGDKPSRIHTVDIQFDDRPNVSYLLKEYPKDDLK